MNQRPKYRQKTTKLSEEKVREKLDDIRFGNDFLDRILEAQTMKEKKIDNFDYTKLKI